MENRFKRPRDGNLRVLRRLCMNWGKFLLKDSVLNFPQTFINSPQLCVERKRRLLRTALSLALHKYSHIHAYPVRQLRMLEMSVLMMFSISLVFSRYSSTLFMECRTVVWSRENTLPISGSE